MTHPFAGTIKMETVTNEDGKVTWKYNDPTVIAISQASYDTQSIIYGTNNAEWARIDKDLKLVHLDMDLCVKGSANAYTALAIGVWNAALEEAAKYAAGECGGAIEDAIRELKK